MIGGDALNHLSAVDHAAAPPTEDRSGDVGHEHLVRSQIPLPDAAAGRLHRQAETLLGVGEGALGVHGLPVLDHQEHREQDADGQRAEDAHQLAEPGEGLPPGQGAGLPNEGHQAAAADGLHRQAHPGAVRQPALRTAIGHVGGGDPEPFLERGRIPCPVRSDDRDNAPFRGGDRLDRGAEVVAEQARRVSGGKDLHRSVGT